MIALTQALEAIYSQQISPKGVRRLFLMESLGYILAEDIVADDNSPLYPTASMDGYAIRHSDQEKGKIKIEGILPAGSSNEQIIDAGACIKTFTGSIMTDGSDTLIPIENVVVEDGYIHIQKAVPFGFSVRKVGENYTQGEVLIKKGALIGYAEIGVMASLNISQVSVFQKPSVGIIATGSEIVDLGAPMQNPSQIRSSNHLSLEALCLQQGATVNRYGTFGDDKAIIKEMIVEALKNDDIVVTTGGVSVGDFDFVKDIIKEMEVEYLFDKVSIKPGRHIKVVKIGQKYIFALPGFPYSSFVTFMLFALPVIWALQGKMKQHTIYDAIFEGDYNKKSNFTEIIACNHRYEDGAFVANLEGKKDGSSAILTNLLDNSGFIITKTNLEKNKKTKLLLI